VWDTHDDDDGKIEPLYPKPYTLNPNLEPLNPKPYTLNPTP